MGRDYWTRAMAPGHPLEERQPEAAHAATGEGEDYDDGIGAFVGLLSWPSLLSAAVMVGAILAAIFGVTR